MTERLLTRLNHLMSPDKSQEKVVTGYILKLMFGYAQIFFFTKVQMCDGSFVSTGACNLEVPGSNPGRAEYLSSWLCIPM